MKNILIVSESGTAHASGLVGGAVYLKPLEDLGYHTKHVSRNFSSTVKLVRKSPFILNLFFNSWLKSFLHSIKNFITLILDYIIIKKAAKFDIVYLVKVDDLKFINKIKRSVAAQVVLYFGDAMWLYNDQFPLVLRRVDKVITDNNYTANYVERFNKNCFVVPDYPQIETFDKLRETHKESKNDKIVIGWIGSPSTVYNLYEIWDVLEKIFSKYTNIKLRLVGPGNDMRLIPLFEKVQFSILPYYSQEEMIEEVLNMDIGLFPLQATERSRARGILKSCIYMSGEVAVIASPVGEVADLIKDGVNGFLAYSHEDWLSKIEMLISNTNIRKSLARKGLELVRTEFSLKKNVAKLVNALES